MGIGSGKKGGGGGGEAGKKPNKKPVQIPISDGKRAALRAKKNRGPNRPPNTRLLRWRSLGAPGSPTEGGCGQGSEARSDSGSALGSQ
ncbi:hypothetical protein LZ554_000878 [Drepanopeziza brunnea f. sp. 'monogermtubi']|nr:hypothetical protein LZ554_000878 [Drepanopeziza brunnea f. sp. 'monogermtubi']